ncbi:hypothetical protein PUN28_000266 [Cardiocondyla obscurior]|uniref:Nucleolin-like n=1 Tax=Cardiocondyla obscurior TaxID=286306 RepID=A0AAW2GYM7_9HYME
MKKIKDYSDEDDYEVDDPDYPEVEGASEEEWTPEAGPESGTKIRPQRGAKKRQHSEEEEEEEEEDFEEDEEEEDEESDSDTGKKSKRKKQSKKEDEERDYEDDEDSDDNSYNETGDPPKEYTSGSFVLAKADLESKNKEDNISKGKSNVETSPYPTLWRIDGKALLQKFLPFEEDGKVLYKSTTTYSGWQQSNKDNYIAVQVSFKVQSRQETIVELHFDPTQPQEVKDDKED